MFKRLDNDAPLTLTFTLDGRTMKAAEGDTIAAALLAAGETHIRTTPNGERRGPFCLMGACYECLVEVGHRNVQACMTLVVDGMEISRVKAVSSSERTVSDD